MRAWPGTILLALAAAAAAADEGRAERFDAAERRAFEHYNRKEWNAAVAAFERQIAVFHGNPRPYYNIACCYALQGDAERAATWLALATANGWRDLRHLDADGDFDAVRGSEPFASRRAELAAAIEAEGEPLPRLLPPESAPVHGSAAAIARRYDREAAAAAETFGGLLEERQIRRMRFDIWNRRLAALERYLRSDPAAIDADEAAADRVEVAFAFLDRSSDAPGDATLRELSSALVLRAAEQFVRGWPQSARLPRVRLLRGLAMARRGDAAARDALRAVAEDWPESGDGALALGEACRLSAEANDLPALRRDWPLLAARLEPHPVLAEMLRPRLTRARVLVNGVRVTRPEGAPLSLHLFVFEGEASEALLASARRLRERRPACRTFVWYLGSTPPEWVAARAAGLEVKGRGEEEAGRIGLVEFPVALLVGASGELLALDAEPEAIEKVVEERLR